MCVHLLQCNCAVTTAADGHACNTPKGATRIKSGDHRSNQTTCVCICPISGAGSVWLKIMPSSSAASRQRQRRMNARNRFLALLFEAWRRATVGPSGTCGSVMQPVAAPPQAGCTSRLLTSRWRSRSQRGRYPLVPPPLPPPGLGWEPAPHPEWPHTEDVF